MPVNQGVTMTLTAVSATLLFLLASCAAKQNCSEAHCKLLPLTKDVASKFQLLRTSEKGVRMIYLQLKIGNDSYDHFVGFSHEYDEWRDYNTLSNYFP